MARIEDNKYKLVSSPLAPEGTSENPSREIFTVANALTFSRLIMTLVFLWIFGSGQNRYLALVIYAVAATSDFLDGVVARSTQTVSWFGKILDPIVDRMLLFTGVIALVIRGELPLWVSFLVIGRDLYLAYGMQAVRKYRARPIDVVYIGKVTTALLMSGFSLLLLGFPTIEGLGLIDVSWLPVLNSTGGCIGILFVYAGCVCSVITASIYTHEFNRIKREAIAGGWEKPKR